MTDHAPGTGQEKEPWMWTLTDTRGYTWSQMIPFNRENLVWEAHDPIGGKVRVTVQFLTMEQVDAENRHD